MENRTFDGFTDLGGFSNQYDMTNQKMQVDEKAFGSKAVDLLLSTGTGAASGAAFGGVGAIVGGVIGLGKGVADWIAGDKKEADLTKQAEKYNAALDEQKYAQLRARQMSNDIKASQAQSSLAQSNMNDYLTDIQNPY